MKSDSITRSYSALSPRTQANLVWLYSSRGDELEVSRIMEAIPRVALQGPPIEYLLWSHSLIRLVAWWGLQHWQARNRHTAAMGGLLVADGKQALQLQSALAESEATLLALDTALDEAAGNHGIDADTVRKVSAAARFEPLEPRPVDPSIVKAVSAAIGRVLFAG